MKNKLSLEKWIQILIGLPIIPILVYVLYRYFEMGSYIKAISVIVGGILLRIIYAYFTKKPIFETNANPFDTYQLGYLMGFFYFGFGVFSSIMNLQDVINHGAPMLSGFSIIMKLLVVLGLIIIYLSKKLRDRIYKNEK